MSKSLKRFEYLFILLEDRWIVSKSPFSEFLYLVKRIPAWTTFDLVFIKSLKTCLQWDNEYLKTFFKAQMASVENMIT